jgi:hypothetical protein
MSEFQYFEFQAIDKPLDEKAMRELRKITSRAEITPHSLVNTYHWGDFKGNPLHLMEDYFDAHLHYTNWGTRRLMLRLPKKSFDPADAAPYRVRNALEIHPTEEHLLFAFEITLDEPDDDDFGDGLLNSLTELRRDLMAGDLRCLYLGWLAALLDAEWDDPKAVEPPLPPNLQKLNRPLRDFVRFFDIDAKLIEIALGGAEAAAPATPGTTPEAWLVQLPAAEKDDYLSRVMKGDGAAVQGELMHRFRKETTPTAKKGKKKASAGRTAGEIRERYETES